MKIITAIKITTFPVTNIWAHPQTKDQTTFIQVTRVLCAETPDFHDKLF